MCDVMFDLCYNNEEFKDNMLSGIDRATCAVKIERALAAQSSLLCIR